MSPDLINCHLTKIVSYFSAKGECHSNIKLHTVPTPQCYLATNSTHACLPPSRAFPINSNTYTIEYPTTGFLKVFSMESSAACQSVSLRSGLSVQTTSFLRRAEWLQWVFIVNDKMLWFRKIIFQQSHRNMCFLNQLLWNWVQGLFCPSTQSLFTQRLFFCTFYILQLFWATLMLMDGQLTPPWHLSWVWKTNLYKNKTVIIYSSQVLVNMYSSICIFFLESPIFLCHPELKSRNRLQF